MNIDEFLNYLFNVKRYSIHTITAYKKDLSQFNEFIIKSNHKFIISDINHQLIRSWISELSEQGINNRSINRKISTLKSYFKYLLKNKLIVESPMNKVIRPKTSKKVTPYVEEENITELLDELESNNEYFIYRNFLILEILYETGIRLSELINLKIDDINFYNLTIKVLGKRNKERIIPISNALIKKINDYLQLQEKELIIKNVKENYLFLTKKGKKIYPKFVYRIVFYYLSKITTNKKRSPHVLRHTFATHMLNNGADLNAIKEILGHSSLTATQVYSHNSINKLINVYKQAHPRA